MNITQILNRILTAVFGRDVRQALHDGVRMAVDFAQNAIDIANNSLTRQHSLENRFDNTIAGNTSINEVIDARVGATGATHTTLKRRLDAEAQTITQIVRTFALSTSPGPEVHTFTLPPGFANALLLPAHGIFQGPIPNMSITVYAANTIPPVVNVMWVEQGFMSIAVERRTAQNAFRVVLSIMNPTGQTPLTQPLAQSLNIEEETIEFATTEEAEAYSKLKQDEALKRYMKREAVKDE